MKNAKFSTYANICVKNYLVSLCRKHGRSGRRCDFVPLDEIRGSEPGRCDRYFAFSDFYSFLETPGALSELERKVLRMYIENKSYKQMAKILNKSVKSIDNAVCRIKSKLKPYAEYFVSEY
jgi:RNA polymerase sporulation-specific sigma factor